MVAPSEAGQVNTVLLITVASKVITLGCQKEKFDQTINKFIKNIKLAPGYIEALTDAVTKGRERGELESNKGRISIDERLAS